MPEKYDIERELGEHDARITHLEEGIHDLGIKLDNHAQRLYTKIDEIKAQPIMMCPQHALIVDKVKDAHASPCIALQGVIVQKASIWMTLTIIGATVVALIGLILGIYQVVK